MKIFKIILMILIALIIIAISAAVIFIKTFDVNRYKPQIIEQVNNALGRRLDFSSAKLDISLMQGISLKIANISVSEDPVFGKNDFLSVKDVLVKVDVVKYLTKKEVNVPGISIDSLKAKVIRRPDGSINVATIGQQPKPRGAAVASAPAAIAIPAVMIDSLKLNNAQVSYVDEMFKPAVDLLISDLSVSVEKFSLTEAFPFVVECAVLSVKKNIRIEGKAKVDIKTNEFVVSSLKITSDLSKIQLNKIVSAFPMAKGAIMPQELKGQVEVNLETITVSPKGAGPFTAYANLNSGAIGLKELKAPISNINANLSISQKDIIISKATLNLGNGAVSAVGGLDDYLAKQGYNFQTELKDLKIQELVDQDKAPMRAEGLISGKIKAGGSGFTPEAVQSNISADANMTLTNGKLKGVNVLRLVLDKIAVIPGLSQTIQAGLPESYKQKLSQEDTSLLDMSLPIQVKNGRMILSDTSIGTQEFVFKGKGESSFSGEYSLEGDFLISKELSALMVAEVAQLQYLLNGSSQIYIPLKVSGSSARFNLSIDADYVARRLIVEQGKSQLSNILGNVLGGKQEAADQNSTQGVSASNQTSTQEAVGGLLRSIFN